METPLPSKDSLKSLNVEESRAKRLERQQARLRDRGGIFRPTNRNNDLFDILCKATHRQSPARARGRSRSRSVSPRKKSTVPSASEKHTAKAQATPHKRTTRPDTATIVELPEEDTTLGKKPKGKRKQDDTAVEVDEPGGEKPKRKPRTRKAAPAAKKTTKASQRATKKATNNDPPESIDLEDQKQKTKPRGKRKKQDLEEDTIAEDAQPKPKRTKTTKSNITDPPTHDNLLVGRTDQQSSKAGWQQGNRNNESLRPELKVPSGKSLVDLAPGDPALQPIKTKTKKRKVTNLNVEDEPQPQKRKARSSSRSKTKATETVAEAASKMKLTQCSLGISTTSLAVAAAINHALGKLPVDDDHDTFVAPAGARGAKCIPRPKEVSDSRIKHACPQPQAEIDDDPLPRYTDKKNKAPPAKAPKTVLQPQPVCMPSTETSAKPVSKHAKEAKPIEEGGQDQPKSRPPKTASRKRKENSTATKPTSGVPVSKGEKQQKNRPKIPKHVKQKLETQHDNSTSDDEPDPIDFLS